MGTLVAYTDPRYQTAVPFGRRSHWLQMWRSYLETVPAAQVLAGVGTNFNLTSGNTDVVAQHLAKHGIRRARIEIGWGGLDYTTEQVANVGNVAARLLSCQRCGIRPLILLNANQGGPCPARAFSTTLAAPLYPGDRTAQLSTTTGIVPGYTGLSYLAPESMMAGHLITALSAHSAALSQPYSGASVLAAGSGVTLHTLKYRPFNAVGSADYSSTIAGWQTYVLTVARWTAALLQRTGRSDLGFDMEAWNELSGDSNFLDISRYYSPNPYGGAMMPYGQIMVDTAALWPLYPADFAGVALIDGFANTVPWASAATEPAAVSGISMHAYAPQRATTFAAGAHNTPVNALFAVDTSGYEPQYDCYLPEFWMTGLQTEAHLRNVGPLTDTSIGPKGRYARGTQSPCWGWITEIADSPANEGVTMDQPTAQYWMAKQLLRIFLGWLGKGTQAVCEFAVTYQGDLSSQLVLDAFLSYAHAQSTYPADDTPYTSAALAALGRATATIATSAQSAPPSAWGSGQGRGVRAIGVDWIRDAHDHYQFAGDGSAAHPHLFDRDCLYVQPVQVNPKRFVFIYYVMTRDMFHVYDPTRGGGAQYDLPPASFVVQLSGLSARSAFISAYDPLHDAAVPVSVQRATDAELVVELQAADVPYLLTVQERTSGAMAASSYLQHARLNWLLGIAYPPPPDQYAALFSIAPTNTTAGTELSAGNYQRMQIGLSDAAPPTVTPTGTAGSTTYAYQIIKKNAAGTTIGATGATGSTVTTITTGNATLSGSNYNAISWTADANAASYDVLKWSGTAWTSLGNTTSSTMNDTGQATQAYTVPTTNTTGWGPIASGAVETIANALPLVWPVANVNWGTAVAMAIFDAPSGGNMLDFADLTSQQTINSGSQFSLPSGQLILGES